MVASSAGGVMDMCREAAHPPPSVATDKDTVMNFNALLSLFGLSSRIDWDDDWDDIFDD
jgi:hypothetical protein